MRRIILSILFTLLTVLSIGADRYWVGGTDSWNGTAGSKWSTTSGGSGGASEPTSSDNVFLDANSGSGTITIVTNNAAVASFDCTGFTGTLTTTGNMSISINGATCKLVSGMTLSGNLIFQFYWTGGQTTFYSGGKTIAGFQVYYDCKLGDNLTMTSNSSGVQHVWAGNFDLNGYNVTAGYWGSSSGTLTLGSGTWTTNSYVGWQVGSSSLTVVANTSTIKLRDAAYFNPLGKTYYNVWIEDVNGYYGGSTGDTATFNEFKITATAARTVTFYAGSKVKATTITIDGPVCGSKVSLVSSSAGSAFTLSKTSGTVNMTNVSIKDCTATGGATFNATGTNVSGNSGINFTSCDPPGKSIRSSAFNP